MRSRSAIWVVLRRAPLPFQPGGKKDTTEPPLTILAVLTVLVAACQDPPAPQRSTAPVHAPRTDDRGVLLIDGLAVSAALASQMRQAMGTRAEREARAPYSPPGWPLERDEVISSERYQELGGRFATGWPGVSAPFWVGTTVFGARWNGGGLPAASSAFDLDVRYIGHFPQRTTSQLWTDHIPEHLHESISTPEGFVQVAEKVFRIRGSTLGGVEEMKLIWTEQAWLDGYTGEEDDQ